VVIGIATPRESVDSLSRGSRGKLRRGAEFRVQALACAGPRATWRLNS